MAECYHCGKSIQINHDAHGFCEIHKEVRVCPQCLMQHKKCPQCGRWLSETNDSYWKRSYFGASKGTWGMR